MQITMKLPYPPSLNNLYATVNGRRVLSKGGRKYHKEVLGFVLENKVPRNQLVKGERIKLSVYVCPPDNKRRDLSNTLKILEDSLTYAGVWGDDCQIDWLNVRRGFVDKGRGFVIVAIETIQGDSNEFNMPGLPESSN